jgi:hypothetical protein
VEGAIVNDYLERLERQLASLTEEGAHLDRPLSLGQARRSIQGVILPVLAGALALAVAAVILLSVGTHKPSTSSAAAQPAIPAADRQLATRLAVFRRPQNAKDKSLPAVLRHVISVDHRGPLAQHMLDGTIPTLTRYIETLPDGYEVFLTLGIPPLHTALGGRRDPARSKIANLGMVTINPDGREGTGPGLGGGFGGATARTLLFFARGGPDGCSADVEDNIVPDGVTRIRWQFPRQDSYGYVYKAPLTVNVPVIQNVAIALIPQRASCDKPTVVTLYGTHGQILSQRGNPASLDRIRKPIRHGNPLTNPGP